MADTIVPRLETHHADRAQIFEAAQVSDGDVERLFDLSTDIDPLRKTIKDERIDLVIIDPLTAYLGPVDSHRDADVRRTLTPLVTLMAENQCRTGGNRAPDQERHGQGVVPSWRVDCVHGDGENRSVRGC